LAKYISAPASSLAAYPAQLGPIPEHLCPQLVEFLFSAGVRPSSDFLRSSGCGRAFAQIRSAFFLTRKHRTRLDRNAFHVARLQPLSREVPHKSLGTIVVEHAFHLCRELFPEFTSPSQLEQFRIGMDDQRK